MTVSIPANKNFLSPTGYKFSISRAPNVAYNVQAAVLPGISLGTAELGTPFLTIPLPGTGITYETLSILFKIDEDMTNYLEIFNWMLGLSVGKTFGGHQTIPRNSVDTGNNILTSDLNLTIMNSAAKGNVSVDFYDAYPINLSQLSFDTTDTNITYIDATVTFRYLQHTITKL
jgi:hypothetical protein